MLENLQICKTKQYTSEQPMNQRKKNQREKNNKWKYNITNMGFGKSSSESL